MDTSTAMPSPVQMSLSFATDDLVVLSFPPEVIISHRLSLSRMWGVLAKVHGKPHSSINSSMVASWVAHSVSSSSSSSLKREFFAAKSVRESSDLRCAREYLPALVHNQRTVSFDKCVYSFHNLFYNVTLPIPIPF